MNFFCIDISLPAPESPTEADERILAGSADGAKLAKAFLASLGLTNALVCGENVGCESISIGDELVLKIARVEADLFFGVSCPIAWQRNSSLFSDLPAVFYTAFRLSHPQILSAEPYPQKARDLLSLAFTTLQTPATVLDVGSAQKSDVSLLTGLAFCETKDRDISAAICALLEFSGGSEALVISHGTVIGRANVEKRMCKALAWIATCASGVNIAAS